MGMTNHKVRYYHLNHKCHIIPSSTPVPRQGRQSWGRRSWFASAGSGYYYSDPSSSSVNVYDSGRLSSASYHSPYLTNGSSSLSRGSSSSNSSSLSPHSSSSTTSTSPRRSAYHHHQHNSNNGSNSNSNSDSTMSRYTSRYDSTTTATGAASTSSPYKSSSLDAGSLGSYRSSNLTSYGLHHDHHTTSSGSGSGGRRGSGFGGSSSGSGSSGLGSSISSSTTRGLSYSSSSSSARSSAGVDNGGVSLPRSSSFRPSEVLSSSTPRDHVTGKGTYSSSLSRSSSLPSEAHSHRPYGSSRTTPGTTTSSHSDNTGGADAATERRLLRAAQRRQRLREVAEGVGGANYSETSSGDNTSKEPSVERASSLRRDSDPDTAATSGGSSRRWTSGRRIRESSLTEESEGKESSPDVGTVESRRARRLRNAGGSGSGSGSGGSEDSTSAALTRAASALDAVATSEAELALQKSAEARRARRQKRLEEAGRQNSGEIGGGVGVKEGEPSHSVTSSSWRQRLHEQGITGVLHEDGSSTTQTQTHTRRRSRDDVAPLSQVDEEKTVYSGDGVSARRRSRDNGTDSGVPTRRRSLPVVSGSGSSAEEVAKVADAVAAEVETRAERIARYKEERRKQLAHIASITSPAEAVNEPVAPLPSLFTSAKRDKEESPPCGGGGGVGDSSSSAGGGGNGVGETHSEISENGEGVASTSLMSRLRALRSAEQEDSVSVAADTQNKAADTEVSAKHAQSDKPESGSERSDASNATQQAVAAKSSVQSSQSSSSKATTTTTTTATTSKTESSRLRKSPSPASTRKPLTTSTAAGTTTSATARKASIGARESSPKKSSVSADSKSGAGKPEETRKSKSPPPVSSRLMSATMSSAAKGTATTAATTNRGSTSPRSSPSRSSPGPSSLARSASAAASTTSRDAPKIKQTLMPERGSRSAASTASSKSVDGEKDASAKQSGSKYMVRLPTNQHDGGGGGGSKAGGVAGTHALREKESPPKTGSTAAPKLSSSSFSAGSSFRSTDRDSGFGSSHPSTSSFSFSRSTEKDVVDTPATSSSTAASKVPKLRRTARVEVSSSSSREGSEEKQIPGTSSTSKAAGSLKRASSLPSKTSAGSSAKTPAFSTIKEQQQQQPTRSQGSRDRRFSSSSPEKEPSPPKDLPLSKQAGSSSAVTRKQATARAIEDKESKSLKEQQSKARVGESSGTAAAITSPGSGGGGLDDILAKNAEFLSSDEDTGSDTLGALGQGKGEPRKLRPKEEPKLRRSLRRKVVHRSGSRESPARDSKSDGSLEGTEEKEIKEVPADVTITLPTTTIKLEEGGIICPSPAVSPPATTTTTTTSASASTAITTATVKNDEDDGSAVIFVSEVVEASNDAALTSAKQTHDVTEAGHHHHHDEEKTRVAVTSKKVGDGDAKNVTTEPSAPEREGGEGGGDTGDGGGGGSSSGISSGSKAGERKERTPDSDGVFETASDASSASAGTGTGTARTTHRRRREDRSELRKSSLNKADELQDGSSHIGGRDGAERSDQESGSKKQSTSTTTTTTTASTTSGSSVAARLGFTSLTNKVSDIRSRFTGGGSDDSKNKQGGAGATATAGGDKSPGLTRHPSRGKEFSQLLHKFSSTSEASSSERSDSDSGHGHSHVRRELTPPTSSAFKRHEPKEAGAISSSDESTRRTPERTQSLKVVRPSAAKEEAASKDSASAAAGSSSLLSSSSSTGVERSISFKSDFMKKRFSPVPREDGPSDELTAVLNRRQKEVDHQLWEDDDKRGDRRQAKADHFKASAVEEVIADNEVAAVLKARRKEMDSKLEVFVTEEKESSPETEPHPGDADRKDREGSRDERSQDRDQTVSDGSGSGLQRTKSLKEQSSIKRSESFERRKGILKRTPSMPKQHEAQTVLDPKLARIMEQRRQKELEMEMAAKELDEDEAMKAAAGARQRSKSAAEEIEESVRLMREAKQNKTEGAGDNKPVNKEEEAMLCRSVADRISVMQTKIVEGTAPRPRSGATTPKSARSWSGSITPRRQVSVDEGVAGVIPEEDTPTSTTTTTTSEPETLTTTTTTTSNEEVSGEQLMEKLNTLAAKSADFQERRHKFQKRQREDWRTRTQPITLEEIHQADSLDSVSAFRALVRRNASKSIFDQMKSGGQQHSTPFLQPIVSAPTTPSATAAGVLRRPLPGKDSEFPQHLAPEPRRGGRRGRLQRHKTLPVTADELNAIPEGELMETPLSPDFYQQDLRKRDSRADSGILSGSDAESLVGSDSLRSLSLDMDLSDNDPSRLSVSSKASIFRLLDEKARVEREKEKCASGAKRYIDRKKRERYRTQPITDDEVKTAASMSYPDTAKKSAAPVKIPQPEVVNRPKSPSAGDQQDPQDQQQQEQEEDDQLTKLTLAEKVKLFSQKQKEEQEAAKAVPPPRADAPVPRRRQRKLQGSRFNTQPVTPEELAKASKISPLAMSLVKPPDPEMLIGLKLKDQQELMMMHAEATLSQCSSRSGSRPSSRSGSFSTPASLQQAEADLKESEETSSTQQSSSSTTTTTTAAAAATTSVKKVQGELTRTDSEPRGILKKTKSTENVPSDIASAITDTATKANTISNTNTAPSPTTYTPPSATSATTTSATIITADEEETTSPKGGSSESKEEEKTAASAGEVEEDRASPVAELILPVVEAEADATSTVFFLSDDGIGGESSTDPAEGEKKEEEGAAGEEEGGRVEAGEEEEGESSRSTKAKESKRRSRFADRKAQAERYLTQPAPQLIQEKSPTPKRKYEGRHMTQPITPDEMKEAESAFIPPSKSGGGSIADRLNQLKTSGEEGWKRRVVKDDSPIKDVKLREVKGLVATRPISITDRLNKLEESSGQWKDRVEETDAKHFTVANKISKTGAGSESPLVAKILASSKKDLSKLDDSSNASSPVNSPSTPTKEFLPKVPLPKEIIADPVAVKKAEEKKAQEKKQQEPNNGKAEEIEAVRVEVPTLDQTEIEQFFATKEITEIVDKVDMDVDDFNDIFVEANEILPAVRKIRATRKKKATSRNPLKTVSQFVELQSEYIQVKTGAAEKHQRQLKTEGLKRDAGFAVEALAGLASKENFSRVELRKTEPSTLPAALAMRQNPFSDLMLLHVKGRRNVQVRLVEPSAKSMNSGDCFLLVTPDKLVVWIGEFSNIIEKAKAAEVGTFIQQKRDLGYKGTQGAQTVEQAKDHLGAGKHFWSALSGQKECQACGPDTEDELYESSITNTNMVYRLIDGALRPYEEYWGALPRHEMLDKKEVLVFDFGTEFYVWQGKGVSSEKRKQGMALAQKLWDKGYNYSECAVNPMAPLRGEEDGGIPVQASQRPSWAIFGKINQNMETILFREKFADWPDTSRLIGVKQPNSTSQTKNELADIKAYDAKKMVPVNDSPVTLMLEGAHVGRGKKWQEDMQGFIKEQDILTLGVKVWHVLEYDHYEMPEASYGHFHQGDTYVVRWQYMITNAGLRSLKGQAARHSLTGRERCAYFFWQGQDSTINEKGASALMTVELDEERGPQVRVVHGKEPPCFLNLFEGGMIVHIGKREDPSTNTAGPWRQYCLRGDNAGEVCLLEMPISISNLRSHSSLIMLNTRTGITYIWHGVKSPKHVRQLAVDAVKIIKEKRPLELDLHKDAHIIITEVEEGEEKAEIWSALDSKDRSLYHSMLTLRDPVKLDYTPRLFYMTSVSMVFEVTEQLNPTRLPGVTSPFPFFQSDLYKASQPALFLLDVGRCVYLWQGWWPIGNEEVENVHTGSATARYNTDRRCAMETTLNYCKEMSSGSRTPEAYLVCAGVEPLEFQNLFPFWEPDEIVCNLALQEGKQKGYCERVEEVYTKLTQTRYTLEQLQERPLPEGVDPLKLEKYLPDEEFEEVMEMKREEFYTLPAWKQNQLKQYLGLF